MSERLFDVPVIRKPPARRRRTKYGTEGRCDYCGRERLDLFWHAQDRKHYCSDVFACEARFHILEERDYRASLQAPAEDGGSHRKETETSAA